MSWIDIVIIIITIWFAVKGFRNGLVIELSAFVALAIALWGALKYGNLASKLLAEHLDVNADYLPYVSFILTFLVFLIVVSIISRFITKTLDFAQLGIINRFFGMIFSCVKIAIILAIIVNGIDRINKYSNVISSKTINESFLYQPLNRLAHEVYKFSNDHFDDVKQQIDKTLRDIKKEEV